MDRKRPLTEKELQEAAENLFCDSDDSDDSYEPSDEESEANDQSEVHNESFDEESEIQSDSYDQVEKENEAPKENEDPSGSFILWSKPDENFVSKMQISRKRTCTLASDIKATTPYECFQNIFPHSLYLYIAQCTNERIRIQKQTSRDARMKETDKGELQVVLGCMLVMCYNHVPQISDYWSTHPSLGNSAIQNAIARDRFKLISSKMYFASPTKPAEFSKTYYIDNVVNCLKSTFQKCRQDSSFQSIDESMTKFKGRSSLKQYMPLKPVKRGIKLWLRSDSFTGYTYDFNIYTGRETERLDGTLGERVVKKLISTAKEKDITFCFDRFFTSITLLQNMDFAAVGTCNKNRKNLPKIKDKLKRGEYMFQCSKDGLLFVKWQDTKEVLMLSNCHTANVMPINKTLKDGSKISVTCPEMVASYREIMGGVDLADQMMGLYEIDRKSNKWWKKVFYRLLMMAVVNAWIIYKEKTKKKIPLLQFLVPLAEEMIAKGRETATVRRLSKKGRPSGKRQRLENVSLHLPVEGTTRRRCKRCAENKTQKRTKTICQECDIPLCSKCFAIYHS